MLALMPDVKKCPDSGLFAYVFLEWSGAPGEYENSMRAVAILPISIVVLTIPLL